LKIFCLLLPIIYTFCSSLAMAEIKIALTFDDGPAGTDSTKNGISPTKLVLDVLRKEQISAAFFVLTGPDYWRRKILTRGETLEGFELIKNTLRDGHLVQCHWGGTYQYQNNLHPNRLLETAYDYDQDNIIDKITSKGNALETDLMQCLDRVNQAMDIENITDNPLIFLRPPLWKFKNMNGDARPTYSALNLNMILTDAKLFDGGFGFQMSNRMMRALKKAINAGEDKIVLTLHDAMIKTARNLPDLLKIIRSQMKKLGFVENKDWSFTKSRTEIRSLFQSKSYYHLNKYQVENFKVLLAK